MTNRLSAFTAETTSQGVHPAMLSGELIRPQKIIDLSRTLDGLSVPGTLWLSCQILGIPWSTPYTWAAVLGLFLFQFFAEYNEVYRTWRGSLMHKEAMRILGSWVGAVLGLLFIVYFAKSSADYSRRAIAIWSVLAPSAILLLHSGRRLFLRYIWKRGRHAHKVAIAGARELGPRLAQAITGMPWLGLQFVGYYDDRAAEDDRRLTGPDLCVLGGYDALIEDARRGVVDVIYIVLPLRAEERVKELIGKLADTTVSVYVVPDFFLFDLLNARWTSLQGIPAVSIYESPFYGVDGMAKRLEDVILSVIILLFVAVPMLVIAIGVKLSSPGPVIFKQRRYGFRGEEIEVWKFRTMFVCENGDNVVQAKKSDPRVTPFGAFLRRTSLDELAQLINVLQGRMSIVGPRPHAVAHNEQYRSLIQGYMLRHKVKPGITGWAQVRGLRGETETVEKMQRRVNYDLAYIRHWSLYMDAKIILLTIPQVLFGKKAY